MQILGRAPAPNKASSNDTIIDVTTSDFMANVIDASMQQLVLVDFWAPWCGPCNQLTPILEKVVSNANGKVRLAKMNIDTDPAIPGQLGVQSIPAVFAFKNGQPVDAFMGVQSESQIKAFIEKHAGDLGPVEVAPLLEQAEQLLSEEKYDEAIAVFFEVVQLDEENADAMAGMIRCNIALGDLEAAGDLIEALNDDVRASAAIKSAEAALQVARNAESLGDIAPLHKAVEENPENHQKRMELAEALAAKGDKEQAVDQLMHIIAHDREWEDDRARKKLLEFFEAWGFKDPATVQGRRKLSSVLFR